MCKYKIKHVYVSYILLCTKSLHLGGTIPYFSPRISNRWYAKVPIPTVQKFLSSALFELQSYFVRESVAMTARAPPSLTRAHCSWRDLAPKAHSCESGNPQGYFGNPLLKIAPPSRLSRDLPRPEQPRQECHQGLLKAKNLPTRWTIAPACTQMQTSTMRQTAFDFSLIYRQITELEITNLPSEITFPFLSPLGFAGLVLTTPGEKKESGSKTLEFYNELWFIVLMAMLGLVLLAIFLSLILQRKIHKEPFIRERPPLVPLQKRMSSLSVYPPGENHTVCVQVQPDFPVTGLAYLFSFRGRCFHRPHS